MARSEHLTPDDNTIAGSGSIVRLTGQFDTRALAHLPERLDNAAIVVAEPSLAVRLRQTGLRVPVVDDTTGSAVIDATAERFRPDATPEVIDRTLVAGAAHRRMAQLGDPGGSDLAGRVSLALERLDGAHAEYGHAHARRFVQTLERLRRPGGRVATLLELSSFPVVTEIAAEWGFWCAATVREGNDAQARPSNPFDATFGRRVELNVEIETQRLPCEDELFDVVLALEIIEHLPRDPMQLLVEANRVLRTGGQLIVSTPNIIGERAIGLARQGLHPANYYFFERSGSLDRHHFEWTPALLGSALRAAGFYVDELATHFSWWDSEPSLSKDLDRFNHPRHLRGDNIIATATKVTSLVQRMPDELYTGEVTEPEWVLSGASQPRLQP
ncbi:MAG: class I SAM-dependent methyltransferase [Acidimicrobiales bacterium]